MLNLQIKYRHFYNLELKIIFLWNNFIYKRQNFVYRRVKGLVFGLSECRNLVDNQQLAALIIENEVTPRVIVHPLLEACNKSSVPAVCLTGLKKISSSNFGIATSCLGIKLNLLKILTNKITEISKKHKPQDIKENSVINVCSIENNKQDINMKDSIENIETVSLYPYLYRTDKKRVFIPENAEKVKTSRDFIGQNFVAFSSNEVKKEKSFKKMIVKRISNNPNRAKVK